MREAEAPEKGESNEYIRLESIILNWTDAVRHYRSATARNPSDTAPSGNEDLTLKYLKRMRELLAEEKEKSEQELEQSGGGSGGQGPPQEGDGEGEPQDGEGGGQDPNDGQGNGDQQQNKGSDDDGDEKKGPKGDEKEDKDGKNGKQGEDPNESPEERARRILSENADVEKGPLTPGRREFRPPEKDW